MSQEFAVGLQDVLVIAEDVGQTPHLLSEPLSHLNYPILDSALVERGHGGVALSHVDDFGHFSIT